MRAARAVPLAVAILLLPALVLAAPEDGERRIATGLAKPVALAFRQDGALLYNELETGRVRALADEHAAPTRVAGVASSPGGNGGFTGLAVDPEDPRVLYVVYSREKASAPEGKVNRVSKLVSGAETVLLDDIPWSFHHDGGRVAVGPDGLLYVTTGDNGDYQRQPGDYPGDPAQDPRSLKGKVLRLTKDGRAAGGVPGWDPRVYALGFRNPFGLAFGPDGTLYASENGINHDEINVVVKGGNYGWPACDGDCEGYQKPLVAFPDSFGTTGIAYLGGKLYMGDYVNGRLRVADAATGAASVGWTTGGGAVLDVAAGPDGCLYVSTPSSVYQVDVAERGRCDLEVATSPTPTTQPPATTTQPPATTPPASTTPTPVSTTPPPPPSTPPTASTPPPATTTIPPDATTTPPPAAPPANATTGADGTNGTEESVEDGRDAPGPGASLLLAALAAAGALARRRQR